MIADGTYEMKTLVRVDAQDGYWVALGEAKVTGQLNEITHEDPRVHLGVWTDPKNGRVWVDYSIHTLSLEGALSLARESNQIAIWDCANGCEVMV